ncbi:MAG: hypothetical protein M1823_001416 [Watsoniomyces obsoletus]|nr:MAG: hypothetical protein M1823_001416 [Watsoniomyces obsoletus]
MLATSTLTSNSLNSNFSDDPRPADSSTSPFMSAQDSIDPLAVNGDAAGALRPDATEEMSTRSPNDRVERGGGPEKEPLSVDTHVDSRRRPTANGRASMGDRRSPQRLARVRGPPRDGTPSRAGSQKRKRSDASDDDGGARRSPAKPVRSSDIDPALRGSPSFPSGAGPVRPPSQPQPTQATFRSSRQEARTSLGNRAEAAWDRERESAFDSPYETRMSFRPESLDPMDPRMAEALRREGHGLEAMRATSAGGSIQDDDGRGQGRQGSEDYGTDGTPTSATAIDHRRRKRVFSNRTKTGCMTCRRRKKKCDEQKPECNNCIRGGFVCEGYSTRVEWLNRRERAMMPLQSKDGESPAAEPSTTTSPVARPSTAGPSRSGDQQFPMYHHHPGGPASHPFPSPGPAHSPPQEPSWLKSPSVSASAPEHHKHQPTLSSLTSPPPPPAWSLPAGSPDKATVATSSRAPSVGSSRALPPPISRRASKGKGREETMPPSRRQAASSHGPSGSDVGAIPIDDDDHDDDHEQRLEPEGSSEPRARVTSPPVKLLPELTSFENFWPPEEGASELPGVQLPRIPSVQEIERTVEMGSPATTSPSAVSRRSVGPRASHSHSNSPMTQLQAQAQLQAQLALQYQPRLTLRPRTEKEKMLAGEWYHPNTPELMQERERCRTALWRFNHSENPSLGTSPDERVRLFMEVLRPYDRPVPMSSSQSLENLVVEAPFHCDYGYNIQVDADVHIGINCTIVDTCSVKIGARTVIGPNATILAATLPIEPHQRGGSQGPFRGRPVIIEEDCWIGAGATILPGIRVGRGATVGASSVVTRNVPLGTVVAGNPARVTRALNIEQLVERYRPIIPDDAMSEHSGPSQPSHPSRQSRGLSSSGA